MKYTYEDCKLHIGLAIWCAVWFFISFIFAIQASMNGSIFSIALQFICMLIQATIFIQQVYIICKRRTEYTDYTIEPPKFKSTPEH